MNLSENYKKRLSELAGILSKNKFPDISNLPDVLEIPQDQEISVGLLDKWCSTHANEPLFFRTKRLGSLFFELNNNVENLSDLKPNHRWIGIDGDGNMFTENETIENENEFIFWSVKPIGL